MKQEVRDKQRSSEMATATRATVLTDVDSDEFGLARGTKQSEQPSFQLGSSISNGEGHWDLERERLAHQTE